MSQHPPLAAMRQYFQEGATRNINFRKEQLKKLKNAILQQEDALNEALHKDLKKSKEEIWITETGTVLSEINFFLKQLDRLAAPQKVATNLINLPGKSYIVNEPRGVVLVIAPWNYPFQLSFVPLVGAIAAGNCVVLKPSEASSATEHIIQEIIARTFDPNYVRCVCGDGAEVISKLTRDFRFDHIFYTGSTAVGKIIYQTAAAQLIPVTLELGGKSPCVVTARANLRLAAKRIALAKFSNAGQMCITPDYLLVHASVKDAFLTQLKEVIVDFFGADPKSSYDYGRIINDKQFERLEGYLQTSQVVFGGATDRDTLYIAPTILEAPDINAPIMKEEIFGPLLPVFTYQSDEEALRLINHNPNPLAFYIFSDDKKEAETWLGSVPSGGACTNAVAVHYLNRNLPFGGIGNSGIGRYHGKFSMETFSHQRAILKAATWPDLKMAYPSFKGKLSILKKLIR
ncbi:aldehyde dehydrogenase [Niabella insulamsoli]|uniref:aldehyde dehydrogenase n=1 Tax=Niabella insulamsoli TaxID=3144874 RepID=UPI0031FC03E5